MKQIRLVVTGLLVAVLLESSASSGAVVAPFAKDERVAFFGDSISQNGYHVAQLELFMALMRPGLNVRIDNVGCSGETAGKALVRWPWDGSPGKYDRVFIMFGMNDVRRDLWAHVEPKDAAEAQKRVDALSAYASNMEKLVERILSDGCKVVLVTPTPYDAFRPPYDPDDVPLAGVNKALGEAAETVRSLAVRKGIPCVDLHTPLTEFLKAHPEMALCRDRVHPREAGALLMTTLILESMGLCTRLEETVLDAAGRNTLSHKHRAKALPLPDEREYCEMKMWWPLLKSANRDILKVKGLPEGGYEVLVEGRPVGIWSAADLQAGIDLLELETPDLAIARKCCHLSRQHRELVESLRSVRLNIGYAHEAGVEAGDANGFMRWLDGECEKARQKPNAPWWLKGLEKIRKLYPQYDDRVSEAESMRLQILATRPMEYRIEIRPISGLSSVVDALCPPRPETSAKYVAGAYSAADRPYREAALAAYRYMTSLPAMTALVNTGKPNQKYQHNAYVSKTHAAHIEAMLSWAENEPEQREMALRFAKASAEYLLKELEPEDVPLAWWPPTYGRKPLEYDSKTDGPYKKTAMIGNEPAGAVRYRGEVMLLYPAEVGIAFVDYAVATKDKRFLDAAVGIAETYVKKRRPDGSWPLKMRLATGEPIGENTLVPNRPLELFEKLSDVTRDSRWKAAADGCFAWLEAHPLTDWNWDGQFEDIKPEKPYKNPTKHNAIDTMLYMLKRFPGDAARLSTCRQILEFCEKRFVVWSAPTNFPAWPTPCVLEQYSCFTPIDGSAAKMIRGYLALYRAEGRQDDLEKAKALANTVTRVQKLSGRIPTFWEGVNTADSGLSNERYDWLNCMAASAAALLELDAIEVVESADGQRPEAIVLSADGPSTLTVYRPFEQKGLSPAVVICPGGGYRELCDTYEGVDMAKWLAERGAVACVLRYRLAPKWHKEAMLEDVRLALAKVRNRAHEWLVDPKKVGVLGFSAGGHLACMAGTVLGSDRADFMALIYPHVSMQKGLGHEHMRVAFLGPNYRQEDICRYSGEDLVSNDTPQTFLVHSRTDKVCPVEHSRRFAATMREHGRPVEFLELESGEHGLGCGKGNLWNKWLKAFDIWMQDIRKR